jgi:hypothetical protein
MSLNISWAARSCSRRVDAPVLATQPFAVQKPGAGEVDHATAAREPLDRLAVEGLRSSSVAQQRA